jgi:hypothetical protein
LRVTDLLISDSAAAVAQLLVSPQGNNLPLKDTRTRISTTHRSTTMTISASQHALPSRNLSLKISDSQKARVQIRVLQQRVEEGIRVELAERAFLTPVLDAEVTRLARKSTTNSHMTRIPVLGLVVAGVEGSVLVATDSETDSATKGDSGVVDLVSVGADSAAGLGVANRGSDAENWVTDVGTLRNTGTRLVLDGEALGGVDMARKGTDVVDTDAAVMVGRDTGAGVAALGIGKTRMGKGMVRKGTAVRDTAVVLLKVRHSLLPAVFKLIC